MSLRLEIVAKPPTEEWVPGMMWRYPPADDPDRECWWIVLPNTKSKGPGYASEIVWTTTDRASSPPHERWNVSGTPPMITVSPSIDVECWVWDPVKRLNVREGSYWHGHIIAGEIVG